MRNNLRIGPNTFTALHNWLLTNTQLKSSKKSDLAKKLVVFLYTISYGAHNQELQERLA